MHFSKSAALTLLALSLCLYSQAQSKKYTVTAGLSAQISHTQGKGTVEVAIPGVELMNLDLTQPSNGVFQIKTSDYNFDGYKDFAFVGVNTATGTQVYDIYLYHPADGVFEALEIADGACDAFGNVRTNATDKTLRSSCKKGNKSSQDMYKWTSQFTLELISSTDNSTEALTDEIEDKAEKKADKAEQRKDKRDELKDKRGDRKAQRDEEKDDD